MRRLLGQEKHFIHPWSSVSAIQPRGQSGPVFLRVKSVGLHLIPHYVTLGCGFWLFLDITVLNAASEQRLTDRHLYNLYPLISQTRMKVTWEQGTVIQLAPCKDLLYVSLLKEGCATALRAEKQRYRDFERACSTVQCQCWLL